MMPWFDAAERVQPTRLFPAFTCSTTASALEDFKSSKSMSTFWSDACSDALGRPLPVLLDIVRTVSGILVRRIFFLLPPHWPHDAMALHPVGPAARAAV
jgi:hypothetical protein